tara:strand:- start:15519 stop:15947 length:429 start_codon:yes stop_codon:yes gene_type:complete
MSAGIYSFTIEQGATVDFQINLEDSSGEPIDLSGYDARMQIRPTKESGKIICKLSSSLQDDFTGLDMTPASASAILPQSSGSIRLYISAFSSSLFSSGSQPIWDRAYYDIEIRSGSGVTTTVNRILEGKVKLSKEVTRNGHP